MKMIINLVKIHAMNDIINDISFKCSVSVSSGLVGLNFNINKSINYWIEEANKNVVIAKNNGEKQYHFSIMNNDIDCNDNGCDIIVMSGEDKDYCLRIHMMMKPLMYSLNW